AGGNEAEGTLAVVGVDDALPEVIVVNTGTPTDGRFSGATEKAAEQTIFVSGRIRHRNTRRDVFVVPSPVAGLAVRGAGKIHREQWIERVALHHVLHARVEKVVQADAGVYLIAVVFVRRLEQRVAQAVSEGQVWLDAPGVLRVELQFVVAEMATDKGTWRQKLTVLILHIGCVQFTDR